MQFFIVEKYMTMLQKYVLLFEAYCECKKSKDSND